MPRKSSASSADTLRAFLPGVKPLPPDELTAEQSVEWIRIIDCLPAAYFTGEMHPLLISLVRDICLARQFGRWLAAHPVVSLDEQSADQYRFALDALLKLQNQIAALMTKLRLTPQARYLPRYATESKAVREADAAMRSGRRPWELYSDDDADEADEPALS